MRVVLSPHLDDAVLSAFSVLREGARVVNVCTGLPEPGFVAGWDELTGATDSRRRMEERLDEDRAALGLAGIEPDGLDFLDEQYRSAPIDQAALNASIAEAVGDATEVWSPAGIGGHSDHVQVREAALAIGRPVRFYAELPYAVKFGWPAWVTGGKEDPYLSVDVYWRRWLPKTLHLEPRVRRLAPEEAEAKLRAMRAYRTQFPALDRGSVEFIAHPAVIAYEVSWA